MSITSTLSITFLCNGLREKYGLPIKQHFSSVLDPVVDGVRVGLHVALKLHIGAEGSPQKLIWHFHCWGN